MADRIAELMQGIDHPRPLPPATRGRLSVAVESGARALPTEFRDRLEGALAAADGPLQDADAPRPLPPDLRSSLEAALIQPRRRRVPWPAIAVAAAVALLAAATAISTGRGPVDRSLERAGPGKVTAGRATTTTSTPDTVVPSAGEPAFSVPEPGGAGVTGGAPLAPGSDTAGATTASRPPPPYAFPYSTAASSSTQATTPPTTPPPALAPLRVGVVGGDADAEAGFRAYVAILNRDGGAGGHRLELIDSQSPGTIVTVNLSPAALTTAPRGRAVLESLLAPEGILGGDVFSFASPVRRQARLAVAEAFPEPAPGTKAVIVTPRGGVLAGEAADAARAELQARGVAAVPIVYEPGDQPVLVSADAAIVLLDRPSTAAWMQMTRSEGFAPTRGTVGVFGMAGEDLVPLLGPLDRALSPYGLPPTESAEGSALRSGTARPVSATSLHGWVTAKSLAVALWQSGADDGSEVQRALSALTGYNHGFAPPYEVRPGTNARTPEALVMGRDGDRLVARSEFRRDPHG